MQAATNFNAAIAGMLQMPLPEIRRDGPILPTQHSQDEDTRQLNEIVVSILKGPIGRGVQRSPGQVDFRFGCSLAPAACRTQVGVRLGEARLFRSRKPQDRVKKTFRLGTWQ